MHKNSSPPRLVCSKQSAKAPIKGGSQFPNHTTLQLITTTKCIRTNLSESGIINKPQRPTFIERTLSNLLKLSIIKYLQINMLFNPSTNNSNQSGLVSFLCTCSISPDRLYAPRTTSPFYSPRPGFNSLNEPRRQIALTTRENRCFCMPEVVILRERASEMMSLHE